MEPMELQIGDVLQLNPDYPKFGGDLIVVTEPKSWGCQGYLMMKTVKSACRFNGVAYLRPKFEDMEYVGKIKWLPNDELEKLTKEENE